MGQNNHTDARAVAKATGAMFYNTGEPCIHGHLSDRRTINGRCVACQSALEKSDVGRERDRIKYRRTVDLVKRRAKQWAERNPKRAAASAIATCHNSRARRFGCEGILSLDDVLAIQARGQCAVCGSSDRPTIDHVVSLSKGGANRPSNLQLLCKNCNSQKHTSDMETFLARRAA